MNSNHPYSEQRIEIPAETILSRRIVGVHWGHWIPHMLGREKFGILYVLVKIIVSVLEGLIDSPKFLHYSSTIDSTKFNLSDSVCEQNPNAAMAISSA